MDSGLSTVRNLLYIVLVLALLSVFANVYVGTQLAQNSDELASLRLLLQKQMMGSAMNQSQQLQKKMDMLDQGRGRYRHEAAKGPGRFCGADERRASPDHGQLHQNACAHD